MVIKTQRLTLRPWEARDVDVLPEIANDRRIWRNVRDGFPTPYDRAAAEAWITLCEKGAMPHTFAVELDGRAIGGIGLHPFDDVHRKSAEIGYWLGAKFWGQGYATEAVQAVVPYGFNQVGLERVQASVYAWNESSSRVLLKAGFEYEGRLRKHAFKDEQFTDVLIYARLRNV